MSDIATSPGSILVRRPTADFDDAASAETFTVDAPLAGLRLGIRTDSAWRSWRLVAGVWDGMLRAGGATTESVETTAMVGASGSDDRSHVAALASRVDAALVGLGTCGSCTSFTIKDAVTVARAQRPVVAVVTEEFETHGRNMARFLGYGALPILVLPYPLEARPEAELREIAARFYPAALDLLGVRS